VEEAKQAEIDKQDLPEETSFEKAASSVKEGERASSQGGPEVIIIRKLEETPIQGGTES
jgi:hypothetical protein